MAVTSFNYFTSLADCTLDESDGTVTVSGGNALLALVTGGAGWGLNGFFITAPFTPVDGTICEIQISSTPGGGACAESWAGISARTDFDIGFSPQATGILLDGATSLKFILTRGASTAQSATVEPPVDLVTLDSYYTLRLYFQAGGGGVLNARGTVQGAGIVGEGDMGVGAIGTPNDWTATPVYFYGQTRKFNTTITKFRSYYLMDSTGFTPPTPTNLAGTPDDSGNVIFTIDIQSVIPVTVYAIIANGILHQEVINDASGGFYSPDFIPGDTYSIYVIAQFLDDQGNLHDSAHSNTISITMPTPGGDTDGEDAFLTLPLA